MITIQIQGAKEVLTALGKLNNKVQRKIAAKGCRDAAKVGQRFAKGVVPVKSGAIKDNLKVRSGKRKKGIARAVVGWAKRWIPTKWYASFLFFGHGKTQGNPAFDNTYTATRNDMAKTAIDSIQQGIDKATKEVKV